jgi:hypothetical protein
MSALRALQEALPTWVRLENRSDHDQVKVSSAGPVAVVAINGFATAPPGAVRADVHFVLVAPTEGLPERDELVAVVRDAAREPGEFADLGVEDLAGGPSYITLGGWLGSQSLALMLIGAVELVGLAKAITPSVLGLEGADADAAAGMGLVMLGPSGCWTEAAA